MTSKQKEQLKKALVYSGLGLLCLISMWGIFSPGVEATLEEPQGLNGTLPQASVETLPESKLQGYALGNTLEETEQTREQVGRLSDYFDQRTEEVSGNERVADASIPKIAGSLQRYEENNRLMSSFYDYDPRDEEREAMQAEIDELRARLEEREDDKDEEEKHLALMEKSYQMAAKYMPQAATSLVYTNASVQPKERLLMPPTEEAEGRPAQPTLELLPEEKHLVSSLAQPMSDSTFCSEFGGKVRNLDFHSLGKGALGGGIRNSLHCVVDKTTILKEGDFISLRLLETAKLHDLRLPRHSRILAQVKIDGSRMYLRVTSIEAGGHIASVKLSAYDLDGQEGIYIPRSEEVSALKEVGANVGGSMGTSFTFASSAKDQIISEAARGVMQGASQLLQKKLQTVKVIIKGGYHLYLVPSR